MKKTISFLLVIALCLSLCACGKSEAAKHVDNMILEIGAVTLDSESAIKSAEAAYKALTQEQKDELENYAILTAARTTLDDLLAKKKAEEEAAAAAAAEAARIEGLKQIAADLDAAIAAIGTVTLDSESVIAEVRSSYDALDEETKGFVTKLADLEQAEADLNAAKAAAITAQINEIGTVTLDSGDLIKSVEQYYNSQSEAVQALVENADVLTAAREEYNSVLATTAEKYMSKLRLEEDFVRGIKWYYPSVFPYYASYGYWGADVRSFALPYMGVQGNNAWLRLVCDYTSGDWVFFEKITFAVDDQRFYKFFSYYDVVRDNAYGDIWEYVDIEVGESEIELLEAIANSTTTVIRFEGDNYYDDVTVSASDKQAIKEMLIIYEYLNSK